MSLFRCVLASLLLAVCLHCIAVPVRGQIGVYLQQPGWTTELPMTCSVTSCCCFNGAVNIFAVSNGELLMNGTVSGTTCDGGVKEDNVNPSIVFTWKEEFFSIDGYVFTLSNGTYNGQPGWQLFANSTLRPACTFTVFRPSSIPLPPPPAMPAPTAPPVVTAVAAPYIGNWIFDNTTCDVNNPACCCFVDSTSIAVEAYGEQQFVVTGTPTVGCNAPAGQLESDDFPWPTSGTDLASSVEVDGFLENQDNYLISFTSGYPDILHFENLDTPSCSMSAIRDPIAANITLYGGKGCAAATNHLTFNVVSGVTTSEAVNTFWFGTNTLTVTCMTAYTGEVEWSLTGSFPRGIGATAVQTSGFSGVCVNTAFVRPTSLSILVSCPAFDDDDDD